MLPNSRNMFSQVLSELEKYLHRSFLFMKLVVDHFKSLLNTLWVRDLDILEHDGFYFKHVDIGTESQTMQTLPSSLYQWY